MPQTLTQAEAFMEIRSVIRRYPWHFAVPAFAVMALVLGASLLFPRKYRAEATFDRRTDMVLTEIMNRGAPRSFQNPRQSLVEELAGDIAIEEMSRNIDLLALGQPDSPAQRASLRGRVGRKVVVTFDVTSTDLDRVKLVYVDENPAVAQAVVNGLVQGYIDRTRIANTRMLKQSDTFFRKEVARCRAIIEEKEAKSLEFQIRNAQLLPESPTNLQTTLAELQKSLPDLKRQREAAQLRAESLRRAIESTPEQTPSVVTSRNPDKLPLETKLAELKSQLATFVGVNKMTEKHPDLIALRQQIAAMQKELHDTPDEVVTQRASVVNPKRAELEAQLTSADAEIAALTRQINEADTQSEKLNELASKSFPVRADHRRLTREVEQAQRELTFWEDNLRSVNMAMAAETGDRGIKLDFIQPCTPISRPISPNLSQVVAAAIGLGLIAGGLSLFFAYRTEQSFSDGQRLADAVNLPLLGAVSELVSEQQKAVRRFRRIVLYPLGAAAMLLILLVLAGMLFMSLERTDSKAARETQQTSTPAATVPSSPVAAVSQE